MFKVVLWDIDGTLLDFEKAEEAGIRGCFAHYNLGECTNEMLERYKVINRGYWQAMERGEIEKPVLLVKRFEDFLNAYGLDASVAAGLMGREQIRRLPVMDNGKLCGMVSLGDLATREGTGIDAGDALSEISMNLSSR